MIRKLIAAFAAAVIAGLPAYASAGFIQSQRAQRGIAIVVTVNTLLGAAPSGTPGMGYGGGLGVAGLPDLSALAPPVVAATQGAAKVQANVTPDPTANLLVLNNASYAINQSRGSTVKYTCAFTVTTTNTVTGWALDDGLASDFTAGFPAADLGWAIYANPGTPPAGETFTAYQNYYTANNTWQLTTRGNNSASYCVDLQLTIPMTVPAGTYSVTAVYSLYY